MKTLLLLLIAFAAIGAHAAPTLHADVDARTVQCSVFLNALPEIVTLAVTVAVTPQTPTGRACDYDLATTPNGSYDAQLTATSAPDALGRVGISAKSPPVVHFNLPLPAPPTAPGVPQNPKLLAN